MPTIWVPAGKEMEGVGKREEQGEGEAEREKIREGENRIHSDLESPPSSLLTSLSPLLSPPPPPPPPPHTHTHNKFSQRSGFHHLTRTVEHLCQACLKCSSPHSTISDHVQLCGRMGTHEYALQCFSISSAVHHMQLASFPGCMGTRPYM